MKELNLEVGQKLWSIQLGDCEVNEVGHDYIECFNSNKKRMTYSINGYHHFSDAYQSLFESNPFIATTQLPQGEISISKIEPESKIDLINAYCFVIATNETLLESKNIANRKLLNLLESI